MKKLRAVFSGFWGGFSDRTVTPNVPIKAFRSEYAEEMTERGQKAPDFPYITYDLTRTSFMESAVITAKIWTYSPSFSLVDDVLSQAEEKIPECGVRLSLGEDGSVVLYRSSPFCDYFRQYDRASNVIDPLVKAGLIRVIIKNYVF